MGRKKEADAKPKEEAPKEVEAKKEEEEVEDPPIVKKLKEVDDKYLAIEREYEAAMRKLQIEYEKKQQPFLDERKEILTAKSDDNSSAELGTPALPGFWKTALKNSPACEELIQQWDEPVLEYLADVTKEHLKEDDDKAGFKLSFHFVKNPYFTNDVLWTEYHTAEGSPYNGDLTVKEVKTSEITWNPGKDVTVEKVVKKVKGGGAKKAKQKDKAKEEPRDSFFRHFFQALNEGVNLAELGMGIPEDMDQEDLDEDDMLEVIMEQAHDIASQVKDFVIPFAVRWYTGECKEDDSDDEDDEDSEEEDDDDDDDDDDSEDEPPKGKGRGAAKKGAIKKSPKSSPKTGPADAPKTEECKQQ